MGKRLKKYPNLVLKGWNYSFWESGNPMWRKTKKGFHSKINP